MTTNQRLWPIYCGIFGGNILIVSSVVNALVLGGRFDPIVALVGAISMFIGIYLLRSR